MDEQFLAAVEYFLNALTTFTMLHFNAILATIIFLFGYKLLRVGLERVPTATEKVGQYLRFVVPGAAFSVLGAIVLAGEDPLLLTLFLLALSVAVGFGLIGLGYRLFVSGVYEADDVDTIWDDGRRLVGRAAPGLLLVIFGVILTSNALWSAPERLREYSELRRESTQQVVDMVDAQLSEALTLFRGYLESGE